jgi:hypothetical protein
MFDDTDLDFLYDCLDLAFVLVHNWISSSKHHQELWLASSMQEFVMMQAPLLLTTQVLVNPCSAAMTGGKPGLSFNHSMSKLSK